MLRFQNPPDKIFYEILDQALEISIDILREGDPEQLRQIYEATFLEASRVFAPETASATLKTLQHYHQDPDLWSLTDYHYLLIHDALKHFVELYNDEAFDALEFEGEAIPNLDFEDMLSLFFWDTDFLIDEDTLQNLTIEQKNQLRISPETFGLAQGLKPHPDELEIKLYEKGDFRPQPVSPTVFVRGWHVYPGHPSGEEPI